MTAAEFRAASIGQSKEEEVRLKLLAWQVYHTMPPTKSRRPSPKKLYRSLTGKGWTEAVSADDGDGEDGTDDSMDKEKARHVLSGMTEQGMKDRKSAKQRAIDLGAHISERRKNRLNGS